MTAAVPLNGKKVLIVEDNFLIAQELGDVMRAAGYAVCGVVPSSARALQLLGEERPDGVLLDIELADNEAWPVAQALESRDVPFLLVTAYQPEHLPPALRNRPCLSKPYSAAALVAMASCAFAS